MEINIHALSKVYPGGVRALNDLTLNINSGMFGLLGPNGAGKSTLMKILATLEEPSSGDVHFNGKEIRKHRKAVRSSLCYLPQFFGVYPQLTGAEFLTYIAKLNGFSGKKLRETVLRTLESVALAQVRDRKAKTYSGGMLRRLGIAQAMIGEPDLLIVDEPTTGLDPEERIRFRNLLADISRDKIIILSTHIVGDISSTCEDLAVIAKGSVVFNGAPHKLIDEAEDKVWHVRIDESDFSKITRRVQVISTIPDGKKLLLRVVGEPDGDFQFEPAAPNLEDAYMYFMESVVGEKLDEEELAANQ